MTDLQEKAMRLALEALDTLLAENNVANREYAAKSSQALRQALAQPEQEPVSCVYKATNHYGETAHFGVRSAAKAWAKNGTVKAVPIKNLKLVQKPCLSCESLARTVMLDQTYHENIIEQQKQKSVVYQCPRCAVSMEIDTMAKPSLPKREWVGLTKADKQEAFDETQEASGGFWEFADYLDAKLKEKNT